jgi:peptidoglycan-N-acetylglucosamine deacetylase
MLWYQSIPKWFQKLFPNLIWQIDTNEKIVYLTFDDGPHPEITQWVVNELKKFEMKATFFCVGDNAQKHPKTLQMILKEGHLLGNHTMHHIKGWKHDNETYQKDVSECAEYVNSQYFRPPYGRIKNEQVKALKNKYKIVMWTLLSCDFDQKLNQELALNQLLKKTKKGSIVVFHDSIKAEKNLKFLLPKYLNFLKENGYQCHTL